MATLRCSHFKQSCIFVAFSVLLHTGLKADLLDEGKTLLEVKKSFIDANNELYDWDTSTDTEHCSWRGVICDNMTFTVVGLNLSNLNLGGEISPSIGKLKGLQSLDLRANSISGQIPDEIGDCSNMQLLDLSFNAIYGDIPFSISKLRGLEQLVLKNNQISGPIPSTLSQIPNLKILDLAQNQLTGEIPTLIYWSEVLQYLGLRNNFLSGNLPADMCRLTGLWYFDVRNNNLTGHIPEGIGNCTSFQILDLAFNQLTGEIPFNIGFLQIATLSLQGNRLNGTIPEVVGLMQALAVLDLSYNQLSGGIPPILGNLTYTGKLYLHGNRLMGPIPPELGNMSKLSYLQVNDNHLTGRIPPELGKLQELFELNLSGNQLEGQIPENISSCASLNYFNVHGNRLSGTIPPDFQNLDSLTYLNLSSNSFFGSIPEELGHIRNLDTLDLSDNNLSGYIPESVGDLEHLLTLNLCGNKLSGTIPAEFGNLRSILLMDLSANHLTGSIPEELGQLQNLNVLYLNNNSLSGQIPPELSNCFSLVTLNLSYNNISGEIPSIKNFTRFPAQSYLGNMDLCGDSVGLFCGAHPRSSAGLKTRRMIIGLVSGCLLFTVIVFFIWFRRANQPKVFIKGGKPMQGAPRMVILHMDLALHSYDDIMRLTENLSEKFVIGFGASSMVYKCILKTGKPIAVKKLYNHYQQNLREFETELETVGKIKHRNLVTLHGFSLSPHGNLLFYDFMENGSLWDLLHGPVNKVKLDWDSRLKIALGAAQGLEYLHHDCDPRIVHRDVKTRNILLDENFEAHLSDFGIARCISSAKSHTSTNVMGTIGYIDPEYASSSRLNEKSDVYSFGVVLLELLTGKKAVDNEINLHQWVVSKNEAGMLMETVDPEIKATCRDLAAVKKAFQLALLCTKKQPSARPTMHEVVRVLFSLIPVLVVKPVGQIKHGFDYRRYLDEYGDTKPNRNDLTGSSSSSGGHLFVKFGEVISQNTV
eukprot:c43020_g1_i1 orf=580-3528(+)